MSSLMATESKDDEGLNSNARELGVDVDDESPLPVNAQATTEGTHPDKKSSEVDGDAADGMKEPAPKLEKYHDDANADANADASNDADANEDETKATMDLAWDDSEGKASDDQEQSASKGPRDPIMKEIAERLQCCKLSHPVPTPMESCSNGHLLCKVCLVGLKKARDPKCPKCDVALAGALFTNSAFANIASQCVVSCSECGVKCLHSDLDKHYQYCQLPTKRKERIKEKDLDWKVTDTEAADAGIRAMAVVARELQCNFCSEACPPPIQQCRSGHIACSYCLDRMKRADSPTCPFCHDDITLTGRNLHLEQMAVGHTVKCRFEGCGKEMNYNDLLEHQASCECQPILCATCDAKTHIDAKFVSWDALWEHYKEEHLLKATPTRLDSDMLLTDDIIKRMLRGKLGFITWGHSLNADGEPVRVFPGMYYSKERKTFYFTIRIMLPLITGNNDGEEQGQHPTFRLIVTSPTSSVKMVGDFPAISYRIPHKFTTNSPCLAISAATMSLMNEGGEGIKFAIEPPEDGPKLT
jgi:hypothetical protein